MATMQMAIANIERVDIITEETTPRVFSFDTASDASAEAQISAGAENELRIKNQILAQNITEDIVKGYNVTFTDSTFAPEVFALSDGGTSTGSGDDFKSYTAPTAGEVVARTKSTMAVYASEKDYDGNSSPASVTLKDGEFYSPSYTMKSRPSKGQSPLSMVSLPSLPVIVSAAADIPASPVSGKTCILAAASGITGLTDIAAGTYAVYNGSTWAAV